MSLTPLTSPSINVLIGEYEPAVPPFSYLICSRKLFNIYDPSFSQAVNGLQPDYIVNA